MKKPTLNELGFLLIKDELIVRKVCLTRCPESADIAVICLNRIKELEGLTVFLLLCKAKEFESAKITGARHILVEPNTLFLSLISAS